MPVKTDAPTTWLLALIALLATFAIPPAHARGIKLDFSQQNLVASYAFSLGSDTAAAAEFDVGLLIDTGRNSNYFIRSAVYGNISGTGEGWRIGGGGQLNFTHIGSEQRLRIGISRPNPHSIDLFFGFSYTFSGKLPVVLGFDMGYAPEILSFGQLENKFFHYSYVNFELLPAFTLRVGYQGHNFFFKNDAVVRLNTRFFLGLDILF